MKHILLLFILLLSVSVVNSIDEADNMPDLSDIPADARAVVYGELMLQEEWTLFFIYEDVFQVNVAWQYDRAVVIITRIEFLSSELRDDYADDIGIYLDTIMDEYSPYTIEAECEQDNIILYHMDALNYGVDFDVNYYVWAIDETELWLVGLYFPDNLGDELEPTSALFQPEFSSCPIEGD